MTGGLEGERERQIRWKEARSRITGTKDKGFESRHQERLCERHDVCLSAQPVFQ